MPYYEAYKTFGQPIVITDEADITALRSRQLGAIDFPRSGEIFVRYCDWPPLGTSPLHRHETIDFGIVVHGEMEAIMDSGETRLARTGDIVIQRSTLHGWRNPSETTWARVCFVINGQPPPVVNGEVKGMNLDAFGK